MISHVKIARTGIFCIPHRSWHGTILERTEELMTNNGLICLFGQCEVIDNRDNSI